MNRTDSYATHVLQFGSNASNSWSSKSVLDWKADFSIPSGTGTKSWDLTAHKDILQGYTGTWYLQVQHGSGTNSYSEFNGGTGSTSPRLVIEYEDSSLTVPGNEFTIGTESAIVVGNAGSGLTHKLTYSIGTASGALADGASIPAGSTVNWTPDAALANQITDDMVGDITFTLENYLSGVLQSSRALTFPLNVPATYLPTISSASYTLQNTAGDAIGVYVQNQSRTVCTISASSVYGASIVEYRLTIGGVTYSSASNVITSDVLAQYGVLSGTVTVVDSRGQTATYTNAAAATVYQYFAPMITAFSLLRCTSDGTASNVGTYIKYVLNVVFAPINNLNTKSGELQIKLAGGEYGSAVAMSAISAYSTTVFGVIGAGAIGSAGYVVAALLTDRYSTTTVEAELASSKIWFDLHSSGEGMAVGKPADTASRFDVGIPSQFDKAVNFDVAPTVAAESISNLLAGIMPLCLFENPVAEDVVYNSDSRYWLFGWQTITNNGASATFTGGVGGRQVGVIIPAVGFYRMTFNMNLSKSSSESGMGMIVLRQNGSWNPPTATNYMIGSQFSADTIQASRIYVPAYSTTNTIDSQSVVMYCNAGDKVMASVYAATVSKTIQSSLTSFSVQRVG
jgi:hypothetical protein